MYSIARELGKLFELLGRVESRAARGLVQHGVAKTAIAALAQLECGPVAYRSLNAADKAIVDESIEFLVRLGGQYVEHHAERERQRGMASRGRQTPPSLGDEFLSHASEFLSAAEGAVDSRVRSHGYDFVVGRPPRTDIFMESDVIKQFVLAMIRELQNAVSSHANDDY